jgi:hypothetical protein
MVNAMSKEAGYSKDEHSHLNWVRCHQQVIFLSDIFGLSGRLIDRKSMTRRPEDEKWSTLIFPKERPPPRDFTLWRRALDNLAPRGLPRNRLGAREHTSHKIGSPETQQTEVVEETHLDFWQIREKWGRTWM